MVYSFRAAVSFWEQTTWNLSGLPPKRDCSSKGVDLDLVFCSVFVDEV